MRRAPDDLNSWALQKRPTYGRGASRTAIGSPAWRIAEAALAGGKWLPMAGVIARPEMEATVYCTISAIQTEPDHGFGRTTFGYGEKRSGRTTRVPCTCGAGSGMQTSMAGHSKGSIATSGCFSTIPLR